MLLLNPLRFDKIWGYENWLASTHENGFQKEFYDYCGGSYPLLVKVIQANDSLSVQVHPDDETAVRLEGSGSVGKTECWYVLEAEKGAGLVYGLNGDYSGGELEKAINDKSLESYLNRAEVKKGDFVFIPPGTVHAIGGGLRLLEVQQACDLTYRFYDWGRPRELHIEKGLASLKNNSLGKIRAFPGHFECGYFSLEEISVSGGYSSVSLGKKGNPPSTVLYFVLEGAGRVRSCPRNETPSPNSSVEFRAEDIIALSGGEKITFMADNVRLMKICAK